MMATTYGARPVVLVLALMLVLWGVLVLVIRRLPPVTAGFVKRTGYVSGRNHGVIQANNTTEVKHTRHDSQMRFPRAPKDADRQPACRQYQYQHQHQRGRPTESTGRKKRASVQREAHVGQCAYPRVATGISTSRISRHATRHAMDKSVVDRERDKRAAKRGSACGINSGVGGGRVRLEPHPTCNEMSYPDYNATSFATATQPPGAWPPTPGQWPPAPGVPYGVPNYGGSDDLYGYNDWYGGNSGRRGWRKDYCNNCPTCPDLFFAPYGSPTYPNTCPGVGTY